MGTLGGPQRLRRRSKPARRASGRDERPPARRHRSHAGAVRLRHRAAVLCQCLRVLNFATYFYDSEEKDRVLEWSSSKRKRCIDLMAFALAYHDIALWTDGKLDYLDPSLAVMERDLKEKISIRELFQPPLMEEEKHILAEMILQHHKILSYSVFPNKPSQLTGQEGELLINAVRKGDWVDATMGLIKHGIPTDLLEAAYAEIPEAGFHKMLAGMGGRLSPESFIGQFESPKIFKI